MASGRCSGCHQSGDLKLITSHVLMCSAWAALYRTDPASALMPAKEHERWAAQDRDAERAAHRDAITGDTQRGRAVAADRFKTTDPLGD